MAYAATIAEAVVSGFPTQPDDHDRDMLITIYASARFYWDVDFGGDSLDTKTPPINMPSLTSTGWDNAIFSVHVAPGRSVELYENDNYGDDRYPFADCPTHVPSESANGLVRIHRNRGSPIGRNGWT